MRRVQLAAVAATMAVLGTLGCGGRHATSARAATAGEPLTALLGQPLDAPGVLAFTRGATLTELPQHGERRWAVVGDDFACDLVALRGPISGEQAWRTFKLECERIAAGARPRTYTGGLPAGLTWTASEHAYRRTAYEAAPIRGRLFAGGRDEADFGGRPMPAIDRFAFVYPQARLFPDALPPPPPAPTEPPTPTDAWWGIWQSGARKFNLTERERRFVRIDVPAGTNLGTGHLSVPTTPGRRYAVVALVEYADGGNLVLTGTRAEPRPEIGPIAYTTVGTVWYGGAVAGGDQLIIDIVANNASAHTRCSLWVFHGPPAEPPAP